MSESRETEKESSLVIQEIESQLERLLAQRKDEIDRELAARIREEEEAARARIEGVEKDIDRERESLREFQGKVAESEGERQALLDEIEAGFARALDLQSQIEGLVKRTADEIGKIGELQRKLESLRRLTSERAAFLKQDLKERFGIVADARPEEPRRPDAAPDLDAELEKLRRIRTLLSGATEGRSEAGAPQGRGGKEIWGIPIPEIQELIQATKPHEDARPEEPSAGGTAGDAVSELESLRRIEPVSGSGEISYFRKGDKAVLDAGRLLDAMDRAVEASRKLIGKLEATESPRDRFFIKQELINGQEGLRGLVQRAVDLCERGSLGLPAETADTIDAPILRGVSERLSMGNWADAGDFAAFASETTALRTAFLERTASSERYARSILSELGGPRSVERPGLS